MLVVPFQFQNGTVHHETERGDLVQAHSVAGAVEAGEPWGGGGGGKGGERREIVSAKGLQSATMVVLGGSSLQTAASKNHKTTKSHAIVCDT